MSKWVGEVGACRDAHGGTGWVSFEHEDRTRQYKVHGRCSRRKNRKG